MRASIYVWNTSGRFNLKTPEEMDDLTQMGVVCRSSPFHRTVPESAVHLVSESGWGLEVLTKFEVSRKIAPAK